MDLPILAKDEVLERVAGDIEFLKELTHDFLARIPAELEELDLFISQNDYLNTESKAHSIKGSLRNLGALKCGDSANTLENAAKNGDLSQANNIAKELKERIGRFSK